MVKLNINACLPLFKVIQVYIFPADSIHINLLRFIHSSQFHSRQENR